ncbi:MAG: hypothetical protein CMO80_01195 [Verrucomicrobiales bacterium]|nr:hypothetical protein [Verrucomicrobiales bacterium]|tara:strand:+ start:6808 stop:8160 length:1353 start_codon:yes stop_codon:yes gene_type:complete
MHRHLSVFLLVFTAHFVRAQDDVYFMDGSRLRGQLLSFGSERIQWNSPAASEAIGMTPESVHRIAFSQVPNLASASGYSCRFQFFNGDLLFGDLISLSQTELKFRSWFAGELTAPREALKSISLLHSGPAVYAGPSSLQEWRVGAPNTWWLRNGTLVGGQGAFIAKRLELPERVSLKMRIAWEGSLNLRVGLFTDNFERHNYGHRGYEFGFGGSYVNVSRGTGSGMVVIGSSRALPVMSGRPMNVELRVDKVASVVALLIEGKLVQKWKDNGKLIGDHKGLTFLSHTYSAHIGPIRVSEWDGGFEDAGSITKTNAIFPTIRLMNRDTFAGEVKVIDGSSLSFKADKLDLDVPIERVREIEFPQPLFSIYGLEIKGVQSTLSTDERLTLKLKDLEWPDRGVTNRRASGHAVLFGPMKFAADWVTEMKFGVLPEAVRKEQAARVQNARWLFD